MLTSYDHLSLTLSHVSTPVREASNELFVNIQRESTSNIISCLASLSVSLSQSNFASDTLPTLDGILVFSRQFHEFPNFNYSI